MNYIQYFLNQLLIDEDFRSEQALADATGLSLKNITDCVSGRKKPNQKIGYMILNKLDASSGQIRHYINEEFGELNPVIIKIIGQKLHNDYLNEYAK
jgi:hypothetical protein